MFPLATAFNADANVVRLAGLMYVSYCVAAVTTSPSGSSGICYIYIYIYVMCVHIFE